VKSFFSFLRASLTFFFPLCQAPEKKEGGEVSHSQERTRYE
jgi:hypothetical protein